MPDLFAKVLAKYSDIFFTMKYHNIIALALTNLLLLGVVGLGVSSCNKASIQKSGLYTLYYGEFDRSPASVVDAERFVKFQDPKQIFIHCQKRNLDPKECYIHNLEKKVLHYNEKSKNDLDPNLIHQTYSYENMSQIVDKKTRTILGEMSTDLQRMVDNRVKFCQNNASINFDRCLLKYYERESLEVLNSFQSKYPRLNGPEYLYLKSKINAEMKKRLLAAKTL